MLDLQSVWNLFVYDASWAWDCERVDTWSCMKSEVHARHLPLQSEERRERELDM